MLRVLVVKELKDLLRDRKLLIGMILAPLLIYVAMGAVMSFSIRESMRAVEERVEKGVELGLMDLDKGPYSTLLRQFLERFMRARIVEVEPGPPSKVLRKLIAKRVPALLVVPRGFSRNISRGLRGFLEVYVEIGDLSISSMALAGVYSSIPERFSQYLSTIIISNSSSVNPVFAKDPVGGVSKALFAGSEVDMALLQSMMGQAFMLPIAPMLVVGYAASLAAMSIGVEKEEKTLEVLLSLPIGRRGIVLAKLTSSLAIAALSSVSMMVGLAYYISSVSTSIGGGFGTSIFGFVGPEGLAMFAAAVFLSVLLASTLGLYLGSFGEDVRSAQSMVGFVWIVATVPLYLAMFSDLALDPPQRLLAIASIPFTAPLMVLKALVSSRLLYAAVSMASELLVLILVILLLAKRFEGEKLLVGRGGARRRRWGTLLVKRRA